MALPTLAELREQAEEMGVDISHLGKSRKKIKAHLDSEMSKIASAALTSKDAGAMTWDEALNDKPKPKSTKRPVRTKTKPVTGRTASTPLPKKRRKSITSVMGAHNYVCKKKQREDRAEMEAFLKKKREMAIPEGMVKVSNPSGYDPNKPVKQKKGQGPRQMVCGHFEWHWDKAKGKCDKCFPKASYFKR